MTKIKKDQVVFGIATIAVAITLGSFSEQTQANPRLPNVNFQLAQLGNCGSSKWQRLGIRDSWGGANFSSACVEHDRCYETVGKTKEECDRQFHATLRQECKSTYSSTVHIVQQSACLEIANTYYSSVHRMGGDAYREAQRNANAGQTTVGNVQDLVAVVNVGGKCLDIHAPDMSQNGGRVQVWDCNGQPQQQWRLRGNAIVNAGGKCLDIHAPDMTQNGGKVQVWDCNGQPQQQWRLRGDAIVNAGGKCLDIHAPDMTQNGGRVQVWDCNGQPQQQWRLR